MKIGHVAERLGIPSTTIRYYEKIGLVPSPYRLSGRREFDESAVSALRFIQFAQTAGFSIAEIKSLLEQSAYQDGSIEIWQEAAENKRRAVRQKIKELRNIDGFLTRLMSCQCSTLAECIESACRADTQASKGEVK